MDSQASWHDWADQIDPWNERAPLMDSFMPLYEYDQSSSSRQWENLSFDPVPKGQSFDSLSSILGWNQIAGDMDAWQRDNPSEFMDPTTGSAVSGTVGKAVAGSEKLNDFDGAFASAAAKWSVPANFLKAIATVERGWEDPISPSGATGIMQIMPGIWGGEAAQLGLNNWQQDPAQNIQLGAYILRQAHDSWAQRGAADPWAEAAKDYLGRGGPDDFGTTADTYWAAVKTYWDQMNASGGATPNTGSSVYNWEQKFDLMFGQGAWSAPDWGAFGAESGNGLYDYGRQYGLSGTQHTGIDVPLVLNSPLTAAFHGTVVCGGTNNGAGADGNQGCSAFNDYFGNGAGRIEIQSDDGNTVLIYGHSSRTNVQPGTIVNPGDLIGFSGGMNSLHTHLEARVRDPSKPSGWRIVDPREVLGGGGPATGGGSSGGATGTLTPNVGPIPGELGQAIWAAVSGAPSYLGPQTADFHDWLTGRLFKSGVGAQTGGR